MTAAKLLRTTFETSRLLDFCSEKELTAQIGHDQEDWPLVVLKEGLDNALDACEEAGVTPEIAIVVNKDGITIIDNGPGIPSETIKGVLDYSVRVSNREAYVAPDRGAQGNALKTLVAMPFVVSDDDHGRVEIATRGQRHTIAFSVDPIRQEPVIKHDARKERNVKNGTRLTVFWPNSASSILEDSKDRFLQLADDYTFLNPHLTLTVKWFSRKAQRKEAKATDWTKWRPSDPTCPHWYGIEHLERLIAAYIAHDQDRQKDRSVREFVAEFRGLTGTAKQKAVLEATGLARMNLSELANGAGLRRDLTEPSLAAMKTNSKSVKPAALGVIGKEHIRKRFEQAGCVIETFQYSKQLENGDVPAVIETAFGWRGEECEDNRRLVTGVNWSPGIVNPFRTLGGEYGDGLAGELSNLKIGWTEPVIFFIHCTCPRVQYTDRGKSAIVLE